MPEVGLGCARHVYALPAGWQPEHKSSLALVLLLEAEDPWLQVLFEPALRVIGCKCVDDSFQTGNDERLAACAGQLLGPCLNQGEERPDWNDLVRRCELGQSLRAPQKGEAAPRPCLVAYQSHLFTRPRRARAA